MEETIYDVFARKNRGDQLAHIGYLEAPGDELARVYAWKTYDEESWFEMCVVPRSAILPVNRSDGPFSLGGRSFAQADGSSQAPGQAGGGRPGGS